MIDPPYAFTSKKFVERFDVEQPIIFVVESENVKKQQAYRIGYCFRAQRADKRPGGAPWEAGFTYRLTGHNDKDFLHPSPVESTEEPELTDWLRTIGLRTGIIAVPDHITKMLRAHLKK